MHFFVCHSSYFKQNEMNNTLISRERNSHPFILFVPNNAPNKPLYISINPQLLFIWMRWNNNGKLLRKQSHKRKEHTRRYTNYAFSLYFKVAPMKLLWRGEPCTTSKVILRYSIWFWLETENFHLKNGARVPPTSICLDIIIIYYRKCHMNELIQKS